MPDEVPAQEPVDKGADSEIPNTANADGPATAGLRENPGPSEAALLAEYAALKNEQTQRIVVRDTVLYISITANTAIAAIYQQQQNPDPQILLAIPFASTLLFWLYATNDNMITQIRRYIVSNIIPKLSPNGEKIESSLFGWEVLAPPQNAWPLLLQAYPSPRRMVHFLGCVDRRSDRNCAEFPGFTTRCALACRCCLYGAALCLRTLASRSIGSRKREGFEEPRNG